MHTYIPTYLHTYTCSKSRLVQGCLDGLARACPEAAEGFAVTGLGPGRMATGKSYVTFSRLFPSQGPSKDGTLKKYS